MLQLDGTPLGVGVQLPRVSAVPDYWESSGSEVVEVAALAGLHLDPWQQHVLDRACGLREDGVWAAFQVGLAVARQNGKGAILEARELAGAFVFGERLIIHSAHEQATSSEHFRRLMQLIESVPDFDRRVEKVVYGKGLEAIELKNGARILFKTRTGGGGRGFTGDLVVLDEAMMLPDTFMAALVPTMAATSMHGNPQLYLTGSAVDQRNPKHDGIVFSRLRKNALAGEPRIAWMEWSAADEDPSALTSDELLDQERWAQSNPSLGIRISGEYIRAERPAMGAREFAVERLGVGDWPDPDPADQWGDISRDAWTDCLDTSSRAQDPIVFAFDAKPDRSAAAIAAAGARSDGLNHFEVIDHRPGTGWVVDRLVELVERHDPADVICDRKGPAGSLITELEDRGVNVNAIGLQEHADAAALMFDALDQRTVRHLGTPELTAAAKGAVKRPVGDMFAWSRKSSAVDICPFVAVTLAHWGLRQGLLPDEPMVAWR